MPWSAGPRSSRSATSTSRPPARSGRRSTSAPSRAARPTARTISPACAASTSTCARRPGCAPVTVQHELEQCARRARRRVRAGSYKSLLGHEGQHVEPLVAAPARDLRVRRRREATGRSRPQRASIWTDTNIYNEMGIPAVKIGPRGKRIGPRREEIDVEEMVRAAKIYALAALDVCSRPRSSGDAR